MEYLKREVAIVPQRKGKSILGSFTVFLYFFYKKNREGYSFSAGVEFVRVRVTVVRP